MTDTEWTPTTQIRACAPIGARRISQKSSRVSHARPQAPPVRARRSAPSVRVALERIGYRVLGQLCAIASQKVDAEPAALQVRHLGDIEVRRELEQLALPRGVVQRDGREPCKMAATLSKRH